MPCLREVKELLALATNTSYYSIILNESTEYTDRLEMQPPIQLKPAMTPESASPASIANILKMGSSWPRVVVAGRFSES